jgi:CRP/FNR family transcriptional regulator, cyclic AMP receptor protein
MATTDDFPKGLIVEGANRVWESILELGEKRHYEARHRVYMPLSEATQGIYYLLRGSVSLTYTSRFGSEMIQLIIKPGMIFNEISVLQKLESASLCFFCLEEIETYFFHRSVVFNPAFVRAHPELILNLMDSMAAKSRQFFHHSCDLGMFNSFHNTCRTLFSLWETHGRRTEFAPGLTHGDVAAHLGIHRASLYKILRRLIDEGIIGSFTRRKMTVLDPARLEAYALQGEA